MYSTDEKLLLYLSYTNITITVLVSLKKKCI